jgi:hypothetical protein
MPYEPTPIIPTEPIPTESGTPLTYEQGERLIQLLTDHQGINSEKVDTVNQVLADHSTKIDTINQVLADIKDNTVPVPADPVSNPSGIAMTYEQGQLLIDHLNTIEMVSLYVVGAVLVIFVAKQVYKFFGGIIFGGL